MKKQFQSLTEKGRWLIATLTLLFTLGIGQMWADLTAHIPGVYEKAADKGGYGATLVTVSERQYEVYGFSYNSSGTKPQILWAGTSTNNASAESVLCSNLSTTVQEIAGWISMSTAGKSSTYSMPSGSEFAASSVGASGLYQMKMQGHSLTLKVKGYDQFSFLGNDNNGNKSKNKYMTVVINGTDVTKDVSTSTTIRRYDLTASTEYTIVITGLGSSNEHIDAFSLRLPEATAHTVTYKSGYDEDLWIVDSDAKTVAGCPTQFSYTGYDFAGWKDADNNDVEVGANVTQDMTLTAQWTVHVDKYTVKYMDGTTVLGTEQVNVSSNPAGLAENPKKDCYTFAAWDPALSTVSGTKDQVIEVSATWTAVYSSSATLISDAVVSGKPNVNTVFAASNIVSSITFTSGNYEFTNNETKPGYYGYKDKASGDYMKILVQQGKRVQVLFGNLGADPTITVNGVAKSLDAARKTGDMAENTFTWTASAEDALISITMGSGTNTLKKVDVIQLYTATRVDGKSDGAGSDANVLETTLPTPTAISGWTFTGWVANADVKAGEDTKTAGTVLAAGTYTLLANTTFTAQWAEASSTYDITYVSAHGTAPAADNAASVVLAELSAEGWAHKGWTANVDVTVDAATVEAGTLIANGKTVVLASNVTFTAVWKEIFTVTFDAKGGSSVAPIDVEDGASIAAAPANPTKDDYIFLGWSETDGGAVVSDITTLTISADKTFYAKWQLDVQISEIVFSNSFKGWIHDSKVEVFYMAGESAPTIASYEGKNLKAEGGVVISGDKVIATGTDESVKEYALTMTAVTPLTATGAQTFDGSEGYVKTRHAWTSDKKWKMSKYAEDGRVARGETSMYIFLGAAESVTFTWGAQKVAEDVAVYVNGTFVKNIGKNNNSAIELSNGNNMVAFYSLQTSGDIYISGLNITPWVPVTAVALKEGEDEISAKEIWASTSFTLTAEVTPDNASNKTITWTSSNEAVATVENGVVTGVAASADPVTITASTVDGVTATCEVTVTTAPEPSADPVITEQPASANYYEGATIAELKVVATGESLTYQWYLGADAIEGAIAATYQPTVSAIGSYVYHCVVTNTEAGNLPTSLATDNATITIADDPAAIKLLDGEGNVNTTNFTTGVTAGTVNFDDADHKCASFGSTGSSIVGLTGLNKVVAYNATTTQTKVKFVLYNTNSSAKEMYLQKVLEGATEAVTETISVPSKELYETQYYTYNSSDLRSFYVTVNSTNIKVLQVKVIDNGTALKRAGETGYELNLHQGRVFGAQNVATNFEGLAFAPSSNAKVLYSTELPITTPLSFTIAAPLTLKVTTSAAKYYVSQNASEDGTTATAVTSAGEEEFDLTVAGTWYIVPSTTSAVKLTNIAFEAPKAAKPVVADLANVEYCQGSAIDELAVSATVSDGGTMLYQWYKDGEIIAGAEAETYQPTADGEYYVEVVNTKTGYQNSDAVQSNTITVTGYAATVLSGTTGAENWPGEDATISVTASGKNLHYAWYTCDDAMGANPVAVDPAVDAAELDVTIAAADTYYKVVVSGDCGSAQEAVITVVARQAVELQDVTGDMTWDFSKANDGSAATDNLCNDEVLANVHGIVNNSDFTSDNIKATAKKFKSGKLQASMIKFHTTVDGMITVVFSNTGNKSQDRYLTVNGRKTDKGSKNETAVTYTGFVYAGDVELGVVEGDGNMLNFTSVQFTATTSYTRPVNPSFLGTLCWTNNAVLGGATLYVFAGKNENNYLVFDEVEENRLEAGKPYIFMPENGNTEIKLYNTDNEAALTEDQAPVNNMYGTITGKTLIPGVDDNMYYFSSNHIWAVKDFAVNIPVPAYYCYVDYAAVLAAEPAPAPAPGRRRVTMGVKGEQVATGIGEVQGDKVQSTKVLIDGHIYILRGEKLFDATGRLVK